MKRATLILLLPVMLCVAGCGEGPCAGYGCPAFAPAVAQAPQQPAGHAQTHEASPPQAPGQNDRVVVPAAGQ